MLALLGVAVVGGGAYAATQLIGGGSSGTTTTVVTTVPTTPPTEGAVASAGAENPTAPSGEGTKTAPQGGGTTSVPPGPYADPSRVLRRHWSLIAAGDYNGAYDLFYPGYNTRRSAWVKSENDARPDVALNTLRVTPRSHNGNVVTLNASLVIRDRIGQFAGQCRLLSGWVRFEQYGARWYYRPGLIGGVKPDFAANPQLLSTSDPRCP
jgi:hypothetical protein